MDRDLAVIRPLIRRYQAADLDAMYRVCLLTANIGGDGTHLFRDPKLPGDVYAVPYALLEPGIAIVIQDATGVGGYVVGAMDSLNLKIGWSVTGGRGCAGNTQNRHPE